MHDLFSSLTGFAWNQSSKKFEADDEVWDSLIQAKPFADKWCVNSIRNYDLMEEPWSNDRATGNGGRTLRQATRHGPMENIRVNLSDNNMDYIPKPLEFDAPDAPDEDLPRSPGPHVESTNSPSNTQSTPFQATSETSSSKGSKRKAPMVDVIENQFSMLNNNLAVFGSYMKHGNEVATDLVEIAHIQATSTQDVATDIRRHTDYYHM
ncbi:hypothetical protein PHAVU_003G113600 [Phaseolus vulgaris]|uniref:Myb/SANT-like domain-containing protein n=1 Tax=Phaseolus vulgaris TaxID=3885 RepID=V7CBT7_PHAVU|nr:hypothetical protein PHAVU_003G113600g [Phaseolus vulgaris]ESW26366.1 hypothetical protein PHAVU_003G113600g [Phaseolus vulgaris]